jgi:hypothetical protein
MFEIQLTGSKRKNSHKQSKTNEMGKSFCMRTENQVRAGDNADSCEGSSREDLE